MPCPPHEKLLAFGSNELDPGDRVPIEAHLADGCHDCAAYLADLDAIRATAGSHVLEDPPSHVLARAQRVPETSATTGIGQLAGKIAALVLDTLRDPLPLGARSGSSAARQTLYRALDYDIDVRIAPVRESEIRVSGQVLPGPERTIEAAARLEVALVASDGSTAVAETNELGEFDFGQQREGTYALFVEAEEDRLVITDLSIGAA